MVKINCSEIIEYINDNNKIGSGKEVNVYYYDDKVIKIFHNDRKTAIKRISDEGLIKLTELALNCFNVPIDIIVSDNNSIMGYTESYLEEKEMDVDKINYDLIKEDLITLSDNGFRIEDLFYNYMFTDNGLCFCDMTCYNYLNTEVEFLKKKNLKDNTLIMNNFLIGLLHFDAFRKGSSNEYTKIFEANEYRLKYCGDYFYGDVFNKKNKNL